MNEKTKITEKKIKIEIGLKIENITSHRKKKNQLKQIQQKYSTKISVDQR